MGVGTTVGLGVGVGEAVGEGVSLGAAAGAGAGLFEISISAGRGSDPVPVSTRIREISKK